MAVFQTRIGVSDGNGSQVEWINALVDIGATYSVLPASLLSKLNVRSRTVRRFTLADGEIQEFPVGEAQFIIGDDVATSRVVFGGEDTYLLGATTLQIFGLIPDTTNHRLIPVDVLPL